MMPKIESPPVNLVVHHNNIAKPIPVQDITVTYDAVHKHMGEADASEAKN